MAIDGAARYARDQRLPTKAHQIKDHEIIVVVFGPIDASRYRRAHPPSM
jgi:hypothetical protein